VRNIRSSTAEGEKRNEPRAKRRTSFFFLARFQILQVMLSRRVFFSCGLRIAFACAHPPPPRAHAAAHTDTDRSTHPADHQRGREPGIRSASSLALPHARGEERSRRAREHARTYPEPGLVEVGLVVAGDDLLDEVARGGEMAALAEEEGGPVAADGGLSGV